ncbi:hypothetical protein Tsp_00945 [Trichinella spiralis]|uniref:hypothetical protein n=1 Tax=Trichinella spiralis TaxID=6334 RepID=UPI0001EFB8A6|nr:hypothetical protein Tsp_00945 [Trichinella spiralis]
MAETATLRRPSFRADYLFRVARRRPQHCYYYMGSTRPFWTPKWLFHHLDCLQEFLAIALDASPFKLERRQTLVSEQHSAEMRELLKRPIPILHRDMDKACFHFRLLFPAQFQLPTLPIQSLL